MAQTEEYTCSICGWKPWTKRGQYISVKKQIENHKSYHALAGQKEDGLQR